MKMPSKQPAKPTAKLLQNHAKLLVKPIAILRAKLHAE
jgi:hypothetical protein